MINRYSCLLKNANFSIKRSNQRDGTLIDVISNRFQSFLKPYNFVAGLSDCRKLVVSILRTLFKNSPLNILPIVTVITLTPEDFLRDMESSYFKSSSTEILTNQVKDAEAYLHAVLVRGVLRTELNICAGASFFLKIVNGF